MAEISVVLLTLMAEAFALLFVVLLVVGVIAFKKRAKGSAAVNRLVSQIKHQSQLRLDQTGSFLEEKYRFEGDDLKKAITAIDKAEKLFMQRLINTYLKRDTESLARMDAYMAEMIETYKDLSPIMPDAETFAALDEAMSAESNAAQFEEMEHLRKSNAWLKEELRKANETMSSMTAEFGNMFGGGSGSGMDETDVIKKVITPKGPAAHQVEGMDGILDDMDDDLDLADTYLVDKDTKSTKKGATDLDDLDDIDDLIDGIDLSNDKL